MSEIHAWKPHENSHLEQEKLLEKLTNFIQMYWDETLDLEMSEIIDQCSKSDTDFEFVIDQSGSGMVFFLSNGLSQTIHLQSAMQERHK